MKTTLNIDDSVMARLRQEAQRQGKTMSELVEAALRMLLDPEPETATRGLLPLPTFSSEAFVDVSDREALYDAMDDR